MLPVEPAHRLANLPAEQRWLVDGLWGDQGVGIVGGEPKCCKSFLALDIAVSVATGTPCLRRFPVARPGRVLLYAAEDALHIVRQRLDGICAAAGVNLTDVDLHVITAPSLRLDLDADRKSLSETIAEFMPRLLLLDPFVRLHRIDENVSGEVAPLLAYLREQQRRFGVSVLLVHHARKGGAKLRAGQALRGSSEFHAWGDTNLFLRRDAEDRLTLSVEHRAASGLAAQTLALVQRGDALALEIVSKQRQEPAKPKGIDERIIDALSLAQPQAFVDLRAYCRVRAATLCERLDAMTAAGQICKSSDGYRLIPSSVILDQSTKDQPNHNPHKKENAK